MNEKCGATIVLGDDYGDNDCTFRCKLPEGHSGDHQEAGKHEGQKYVMTWERSDGE